jgi:hypothetical protein
MAEEVNLMIHQILTHKRVLGNRLLKPCVLFGEVKTTPDIRERNNPHHFQEEPEGI